MFHKHQVKDNLSINQIITNNFCDRSTVGHRLLRLHCCGVGCRQQSSKGQITGKIKLHYYKTIFFRSKL